MRGTAGRRREDELLPDPFWAADRAALRGQDFALYWYRCQLALTLLAALFGVFSARRVHGVNVVPLLSVACFLGAGCFALALHRRSPQEQWYQGRSAAESMKSLTWKYVVRAEPFGGPDEPAAKHFLDALRDVPQSFLEDDRSPDGKGAPKQTEPRITPLMRDERRKPLQQRRSLYLTERVYAQKTWYLGRADSCDQQAQVWALGMALMLLAGVVVAVLETEFYPGLHALGLFSAGAAAVSAWTQLKQFRPLASAYRLAAAELERVAAQLTRIDLTARDAEQTWSRLAARAEDAISREHIVWRARSQHRG